MPDLQMHVLLQGGMMRHYATPKLIHDPDQARERGKLEYPDGDGKSLPCQCEKCRQAYWLGQLEAIAERERK